VNILAGVRSVPVVKSVKVKINGVQTLEYVIENTFDASTLDEPD
jgi:hypothetical protein